MFYFYFRGGLFPKSKVHKPHKNIFNTPKRSLSTIKAWCELAHFKRFSALSMLSSPLTLITGTTLVPIQVFFVCFFSLPGLYKRISNSQMSAKWNRKQALCVPTILKQHHTQSRWTGREVSNRLVPLSVNKGNKINGFHGWPNVFTREPANPMIC